MTGSNHSPDRPPQLADAGLRQLAAVMLRSATPDIPPRAASLVIDAVDAGLAATLASLGLTPSETVAIAAVLWGPR